MSDYAKKIISQKFHKLKLSPLIFGFDLQNANYV